MKHLGRTGSILLFGIIYTISYYAVGFEFTVIICLSTIIGDIVYDEAPKKSK